MFSIGEIVTVECAYVGLSDSFGEFIIAWISQDSRIHFKIRLRYYGYMSFVGLSNQVRKSF
jgi:hypothetical protein